MPSRAAGPILPPMASPPQPSWKSEKPEGAPEGAKTPDKTPEGDKTE
jgi:hypothetical protein